VAFAIVPIFALANAGVPLSIQGLSGPGMFIVIGTMLGLVVGKPLGLVGMCWLMVRSGVAVLPEGVGWAHIIGVGAGLALALRCRCSSPRWHLVKASCSNRPSSVS
jgi:NhaA family Na+:H+ antiporter